MSSISSLLFTWIWPDDRFGENNILRSSKMCFKNVPMDTSCIKIGQLGKILDPGNFLKRKKANYFISAIIEDILLLGEFICSRGNVQTFPLFLSTISREIVIYCSISSSEIFPTSTQDLP